LRQACRLASSSDPSRRKSRRRSPSEFGHHQRRDVAEKLLGGGSQRLVALLELGDEFSEHAEVEFEFALAILDTSAVAKKPAKGRK